MQQPDPYRPPAPATPSKKSRSEVRWILIAAGIGCFLLIAAIAVVFFFGMMAGLDEMGVDADVELEAEVPAVVQQGDELRLIARVINRGDESVTLVDLDISDSYLDGILLESTEPRYRESMTIPLIDMTSYTFDLEIPAGGRGEVVFNLIARRAGDYRGDLDFCIDSELSCTTRVLRTVVE